MGRVGIRDGILVFGGVRSERSFLCVSVPMVECRREIS